MHKYRDALSIEQHKSLLQFAQGVNSSMYNKVYILLNTMCRISELTGLIWQEVDMKNKYITISH
ncbi:MAG: site-specific integrase [Lachnospiraceae bacterium]|nr:site-specific integrase [Lachnospiraceae bacterium]